MNITAVILAGGRSRRMGRSKALLPIEGHRLIDRTHQILSEIKPFVQSIVVSGTIDGYDCIPDQEFDRGPVQGIRSVASELLSKNVDALLVVPVDLPCLTGRSLRPLIDSFRNSAPNAVCFEKNWLPAIFKLNKPLLDACDKNTSVQDLLKELEFDTIPHQFLRELSNTNTPDEWHQLTGLSL